MTARVLLRLAGTKLLESEITTVPPCSDDTTPCSFVRCNVGCRRYLWTVRGGRWSAGWICVLHINNLSFWSLEEFLWKLSDFLQSAKHSPDTCKSQLSRVWLMNEWTYKLVNHTLNISPKEEHLSIFGNSFNIITSLSMQPFNSPSCCLEKKDDEKVKRQQGNTWQEACQHWN